jgi:hypothetical protein
MNVKKPPKNKIEAYYRMIQKYCRRGAETQYKEMWRTDTIILNEKEIPLRTNKIN